MEPASGRRSFRMPQHKRNRQVQQPASRHRAAFFILTAAFPFLFLILTELLLRFVGYGPDISLFRTETMAGRTFYNMNPGVKSRYFSRVTFNPMTSMDFFAVHKPGETFRIFCLGGSTTAGYPYGYIGSFSTFLKQRLERIFPDREIEMVNLGLTATNSFTVLDMARELPDYEPDLVIIYDGHNEFYGALGLASNETAGRNRWLIGLYMNLVHTKTFLLLRDLYNGVLGLSPGPDVETGTMMERLARGQNIPYGSDLYHETLDAFSENLGETLEILSARDIPVIVSSQVSNLRDLRPFVSEESDLEPGQRSRFRTAYEKGLQLLIGDDPDSAVFVLRTAVAMDTLDAAASFSLARALDKSGKPHEAFLAYQRARDLDELRFRQSGDFNLAAKRITLDHHQFFADIEQVFRGASPDSLPGNNLILEHLHPNSYGYFLVARGYADVMRRNGILASASEWEKADTVVEQTLWNERWLTGVDERAALRRTEVLTSSWPFRSSAVDIPEADPADRIGIIIDEMLNGAIAWEQAHVSAAEYYEGAGDLSRTEAEYRALIAMTPLNVSPYLRLGRVYLKQLHYEPARVVLERSIAIEPTQYGYRALGAIAVDTGKPADAIPYLEGALRLSSTDHDRADYHFLLALAYGKINRIAEATAQLENVLGLDPSNERARMMLGQLRGADPLP